MHTFRLRSEAIVFWGLISVVLVTSAIRIRLLSVPLERDEGEYAYAGQLILQGIPPYTLAYNMKMPGIYAIYAGILFVFGQTQTGIHLGLLVFNLAAIVLIYFLAKRLFGQIAACATAASYAILSVGAKVQGVFANSEHFLLVPALGGLLLILMFTENRKLNFLLYSGLLLGVSFIVKQFAIAFILFGFFFLIYDELRKKNRVTSILRNIVLFLFCVAAPFLLTCLLFWMLGIFDKFWFWTVQYSREYVTQRSLAESLPGLKMVFRPIVFSTILIWVCALVGFVCLFTKKEYRTRSIFMVAFLFFSVLSVVPGFFFRPHYFVLMLPAIALLFGILFAGLWNQSSGKAAAVFIAAIVFLFSLFQQRTFFFRLTPLQAARQVYGLNPFPEALQIAKYISDNSLYFETVAIIGSEPEIYFYSRRHSATGYIYMFPMLERQRYAEQMQQDMMKQIEKNQPKYIVVSLGPGWLSAEFGGKQQTPNNILPWVPKFTEKFYKQVGLVELTPQSTYYYWGPQSVAHLPSSRIFCVIFERKN
jgi:4-amino-4-deoxy-L-arabinose transferase-like glycosyltransferase